MDADAKLDAALGRLHLDGAAHSVDYAAELHYGSITGAFDDAPVMHGDGGIEQIAAEPAEPRQCAILVGASEPAIPDHIRRKNSRNFLSVMSFRYNP